MRTLWDLLIPKPKPRPKPRARVRAAPRPVNPPAQPAPGTMADKYAQMVRELLALHGIRVRKWRTSMSGCAWTVTYADGRVSRLIESPRPRGPMSAAVFLHEVGHHAIGLGVVRPRCLEEYAAWMWALEEMQRRGLNITPRVHARVYESLRYAVDKARRRGIRSIPPELTAYLEAGGRGSTSASAA